MEERRIPSILAKIQDQRIPSTLEKGIPGRNAVQEESIEIASITGRMAVCTREKYLTFVDRMEGNGAESTGETGVTRGS